MTLHRRLSLMAGALLTSSALGAAPRPRTPVVMLPFENRSGVEEARAEIAAFLAAGLADKGYDVVQGEPVEAFLEAERLRHLDSLPAPAREALLRTFGAEGVVTGAIETFADGPNPIVGLSIRVQRGGGESWWGTVGLSADATEGMFGRGRASTRKALSQEATRRLLSRLPRAGERVSAARPRGKPFRLSGPTTFRAAALDTKGALRVCLLPLENRTPSRDAGPALLQLLWGQLDRTALFEVVEPAELRAGMVAEGIRSFRDLDSAPLQRLGVRLGTSLFVRGTLETFREAGTAGGAVTPEVSLELSLIDVRAGRVLWTSQHARQGRDYEFLLRRGAIPSAVALADRMLGEMIASALEARASPVRSALK